MTTTRLAEVFLQSPKRLFQLQHEGAHSEDSMLDSINSIRFVLLEVVDRHPDAAFAVAIDHPERFQGEVLLVPNWSHMLD